MSLYAYNEKRFKITSQKRKFYVAVVVVQNQVLIANVVNWKKKCIFCRRDKYSKLEKTRETLSSCPMFIADQKIKKASAIRNDCKMMVLSAEDFHITMQHAIVRIHQLIIIKIVTEVAFKKKQKMTINKLLSL